MQKTFAFGTDETEANRRRHRRPDPQTSVKGAEAAERKCVCIKSQVLSMANDVPMTANELAELAVKQFGGNRETCRKRAMELSKPSDGRLKQVGSKVCRITGSEASAFVLAGDH